MDAIQKQWEDFLTVPFPKEVKGLNAELELLDTYICGCISLFITKGTLEEKKLRILTNCLRELDNQMKSLPETALPYFAKLRNLGKLIVAQSSTMYE